MIWCTEDPNAHIRTFCKRCSFIWRCFFPVSILKQYYLPMTAQDVQTCKINIKLFLKLWSLWMLVKPVSNQYHFRVSVQQPLLKSGSHLPKKFCFICFIEDPINLMKNAFYFILKVLFVLKIFKFLSRLFGHVEKTAWLERQGMAYCSRPWIRLISKSMTSQPGKQTITLHILPNISRSKDNHTMKLGQLIEYINGNIFLRKLRRK